MWFPLRPPSVLVRVPAPVLAPSALCLLVL